MGNLNKFFVASFTIIAFGYTLETYANTPCCDCPYTAPNVPVEDDVRGYLNMTRDVWKRPEVNGILTNLGITLKNKLLKYVLNEKTFLYYLTKLMSYEIIRIVPFVEYKPDGCDLAKIINASAVYYVNQDKSGMNESFDIYLNRTLYMNSLAASVSRIASGCDGVSCCDTNPPIKKKSCYKNGFVYEVNMIWDLLKGANETADVRRTVLKLYASPVYSDKLLALLTTYASLHNFQRLFSKTNANMILESVQLQTSKCVQQCCCHSRLKRIEDLYERFVPEIKLKVERERAQI